MDDVSAKHGGNPMDHPSQPHPSLFTPVAHAAIVSIRSMDSLTDLNVVGVLLEKVCVVHDSSAH